MGSPNPHPQIPRAPQPFPRARRLAALYSKAFVVTVAKELADARHWAGRVSRQYRMLLLEEGEEKTREAVNGQGKEVVEMVRKGIAREKVEAELERLEAGRDVALRQMLRWKVRYFTDGAVVGSRAFVDGLFEQCRERFGPKRKSGARKMRGTAAVAAELLWSARDLRRGIT